MKFRYWCCIVLMLAFVACGGEAEESAEAPAAEGAAEAAQPVEAVPEAPPDEALWQQTLTFISSLEDLMEGYRPPAVSVGESPAACVPQAVLRTNSELRQHARRLEREREQALEEQRENRAQAVTLAWTYTLNRRRRLYKRLCSNTCRFRRDGDCDDGRTAEPGYRVRYVYDNCQLGTDCADCGPRRLPATSDNATEMECFGGITLPVQEVCPVPEIVARAAAASIASPSTYFCRVADVTREQRKTRVHCDVDGRETPSSLTLELGDADVGWWTQGAVLSVAAATEADEADAWGAYLQRSDEPGVWRIYAKVNAITILEAGSCASPEQLLAVMQNDDGDED